MAGKGSGRRPRRISLAEEKQRWEAIFGERQENPDLDPETRSVRYKAHPETGKLIPDYMWAQYNMLPKEVPKTAFIVRDIPEYESPASGKLIRGRRQQRNDLHATGSRIYEGRMSEAKAADSHNEQKQKKFEKELDKSMAETLNDIKYQNNPPPTEFDKNGNAKLSWTF